MKTSGILLVIALLSAHCAAQDYPQKEIDLSRIADDLLGFQDGDANYDELYENLAQILSNPVNLNTADADALRMLHILSEDQIQKFIHYRIENGDLLSIYELQAIPGFDPETIFRILPFVKVVDAVSQLNSSLFKRVVAHNAYLISRYDHTFQTGKGFENSTETENTFKGSGDKLYLRFRSNKPGDFSIGFTSEKDAGEQFQWNPSGRQYGFDYLSYHLQIVNKGRIKNLIAGDFQCQFGQGVILGGAFGIGKGAETITTLRRSNVGFLPYTSVNESGFYRGTAATFQVGKKIFLSSFYSITKRDGTIQSDTILGISISSFQYTGLHRTENEIINRQKIPENSYGFVLNLKDGNLDAGIIFHAIHFKYALNKEPTVYNQFTFQGKENINTGLFLNYTIHNFNFFSEAAKSLNGGVGLIAGVIGSLHSSLDMALSYRKYDKNFYTFYTNSFSESSQPQNETGVYWGLKYQWNRKYSFSSYVDLFKFPWLGFRRYAPSIGHEWLARLNYQPSRKILMFIQAREENKVRNSSGKEIVYRTHPGIKRNYSLNIDYSIHPAIRLKTRVQYSTYSYEQQTTHGVVLLQDLSFTWKKFQVTARHGLFDTEDYDNRNYVYENDVWLAYSLPAYYGVGSRDYLLIEYKINKTISCWLRYSQTKYKDRDEIGSGLDLIKGNKKDDIKVQAMIKF